MNDITPELEKVARAIHREEAGNAEDISGYDWTLCLPSARAALMALREPTNDMGEAAWVAFRDSNKPAPYNAVKDAVRASIDYVLGVKHG